MNSTTLKNIRDFLDKKTPRILSIHNDPNYRQNPDDRIFVEKACEVIRKDMLAEGNNILPSFFPDFGTISTAAVYGGKRISAHDGGGIHIEPVAKTVEDFLELAPLPFEETDYQRAINLYREVCGRLGTDDIYVRSPDFQGPLNTLGLLVEDQADLMVGMFEKPEIIHEAARRVTDMLVEYTKRFRDTVGAEKLIGNIWPYIALVDGKGIGITQDYMPLIGPEQYAQFELPLLEEISDTFGGVYIHCCGVFRHHIANLAASSMNIIGVECHSPHTEVAELYEAFGDRIAITPYGEPTLAALLRSWKGQPHAHARLWVCSCHEWEDMDDLRRAFDELT